MTKEAAAQTTAMTAPRNPRTTMTPPGPGPKNDARMTEARPRFKNRTVGKLPFFLYAGRPAYVDGKHGRDSKPRRPIGSLLLEILAVPGDVRRPAIGGLFEREDRFDRAGRNAGTAVDALVGMDVEHVGGGK